MQTTKQPPAATLPATPRAHSHAGVRQVKPQTLVRPAPRNTWDPLMVDAEGTLPQDFDVVPAAEPPPPPEELGTFAGVLTKAVAEVLLGSRSPAQIQRWLAEDVWNVIRRRTALGARSQRHNPKARVRIIRVHPQQVGQRHCEVSVVFHDGSRVRAAALRLALHRKKWRAVAMWIG